MFLNGEHITIVIAFFAGVITFFASCIVPLVPTYIFYLTGISLAAPQTKKVNRFLIFRSSLFFVIGFVTVFVLLGFFFSSLAALLAPYRSQAQRIGGVLFILLGLYIAGILKSKLLSRTLHLNLHRLLQKRSNVAAFLMGVAFSFGWTPCIGPVLSVILFWSSQQNSMTTGLIMLFVYGLGIGLPFLIIGLFLNQLLPSLRKVVHFGDTLQKLFGVLIVFFGVLMVMGVFQSLSLQLLSVFNLEKLAR